MDALREHNPQTDAEKVRHLFDEYRAGGLAVVAWKDTLEAISRVRLTNYCSVLRHEK